MAEFHIPSLHLHPAEAALVGKILVSYGELEFDLCQCIKSALNDLDVAVKVLYRTRGETQRVLIADALGRPIYTNHRLETEFSEAIGAMRHCLKIRNQYAHCNWNHDEGGLSFIAFEDIAAENAHVSQGRLTKYRLDKTLLENQESYFSSTREALWFLDWELQLRAGRISSHAFPRPQRVPRPPQHN